MKDLLNTAGAFGFAPIKKNAPLWMQVLVNTIIPVMLITIGALVISWLDTTHRIGILQTAMDQGRIERNEMKQEIRELERRVDEMTTKAAVANSILKNSTVELKKK